MVIFKEFSESANKLLRRTVWIVCDDGRLKKMWITKNNIWKMLALWEDGKLHFTLEEAENNERNKKNEI